MYVTAVTKINRSKDVLAYLYNGQTIMTQPERTHFDTEFVIISAPEPKMAQDLSDRLLSGNMGSRVFETRDEALAYMRDKSTGL